MNIEKVKNDNLCIGCGICTAVCPSGCLGTEFNGLECMPVVNKNCTNCGICAKVCPINNLNEYDFKTSVEKFILGGSKAVLCTKSKDKELLKYSASGGFITQTVKELLEKGEYNSAFLVKGYNYDKPLQTERITKTGDISSTPKSRYLTVSHKNAAKYIIENPDEKIILAATGCVISGFINLLKLKGFNRNNYLFLGLFCDKTMNYGVNKYFRQHKSNCGKIPDKLYFRTKKDCGWPGDVELVYTDGTSKMLSRKERMKVKEYFMPERCLYCLDKLNKNADISAGDNYISKNKDTLGANSIVIRTETGLNVFKSVEHLFDVTQDTEDELSESQHLSDKKINLAFAQLKGLIRGKPDKCHEKKYYDILKKIEIGRSADVYNAVDGDIRRRKLIKEILRPFKKFAKHAILTGSN